MGVLIPNYSEENVVKGDKVPNFKIGTPMSILNVFQILQDLRLKQYQGNFEPKAYRPSTTSMTGTTKQPKASKTHETASQNTGMVIYVVPQRSWGDRSDTDHSKCLLLGGRRLNLLTIIPKPKGSGGARAATAQIGPANERNKTK